MDAGPAQKQRSAEDVRIPSTWEPPCNELLVSPNARVDDASLWDAAITLSVRWATAASCVITPSRRSGGWRGRDWNRV